MKILFLDDNPERTEKFQQIIPSAVCVETSRECIEYLKKSQFDFVFIDHDLAGEIFVDSNLERCGMGVVRWIVKNKPQIRQIFVHTMNFPVGILMCKTPKDIGYNVVFSPFLWIDFENLEERLQIFLDNVL